MKYVVCLHLYIPWKFGERGSTPRGATGLSLSFCLFFCLFFWFVFMSPLGDIYSFASWQNRHFGGLRTQGSDPNSAWMKYVVCIHLYIPWKFGEGGSTPSCDQWTGYLLLVTTAAAAAAEWARRQIKLVLHQFTRWRHLSSHSVRTSLVVLLW